MEFSRSAVLRRWYFVSIMLGIVALAAIRFVVLRVNDASSALTQSLANVTDNLLAAGATSIIVGIAYVYLYPRDSRAPHEVVRSIDIAETLRDHCRTATHWALRSRGANYFTTITLANLVTSALATGRTVKVRIQCIDPDNDVLAAAYARSMSDIPSRVGSWSGERAKDEVLASLLRAALQVRRAPRVEVEFGLSPNTWVMSLEVFNGAALVTCQNKGDDALIFRDDSPFYKSFSDEFEAGWLVCRKIIPQIERDVPRDPKDLTGADYTLIRQFFMNLSIKPPTDAEIRAIVPILGRKTDYE